MRFLFRAGALMLNEYNVDDRRTMTELIRCSPIRARTEEYKCADRTFSDLVAGRQKSATVRHGMPTEHSQTLLGHFWKRSFFVKNLEICLTN